MEIHTWNTCIQICYVDTNVYNPFRSSGSLWSKNLPFRGSCCVWIEVQGWVAGSGRGTFKDCTKKNNQKSLTKNIKKLESFGVLLDIIWIYPPPRMQSSQMKVNKPHVKTCDILVLTGILGGGWTQGAHFRAFLGNGWHSSWWLLEVQIKNIYIYTLPNWDAPWKQAVPQKKKASSKHEF